jgi:DNA-binding NarL/FixJ family response regulator
VGPAPNKNAYSKLQLGLSRRAQQLVQLISTGFTNKEIASQLNLSAQTVKNHVHRILRKLDVSDRMKAVEFCRALGIISLRFAVVPENILGTH